MEALIKVGCLTGAMVQIVILLIVMVRMRHSPSIALRTGAFVAYMILVVITLHSVLILWPRQFPAWKVALICGAYGFGVVSLWSYAVRSIEDHDTLRRLLAALRAAETREDLRTIQASSELKRLS